jgi:hypothetical protein
MKTVYEELNYMSASSQFGVSLLETWEFRLNYNDNCQAEFKHNKTM